MESNYLGGQAVEMPDRDYRQSYELWQAQTRGMLKRPDYFLDPLFSILEGRFSGVPCAFDKRLAYRQGEVTIWAGPNGQGKSLLTGQVAQELLLHGERCLIMSFEMLPSRTLERMMRQAFGFKIVGPESFRKYKTNVVKWVNYVRDKGLIFANHKGAISPDLVLGMAFVAVNEYHVKHVFVDNLMKVVAGEDNLNGQKDFVNNLCSLAADTGCHVHLIHHTRKGNSDRDAIDKNSLRGSSSIADQVDNIVLIQRNLDKEKKAGDNNLTEEEDLTQMDVLLNVVKQRNGDWTGGIPLWFDRASTAYCQTSQRILPDLCPRELIPEGA